MNNPHPGSPAKMSFGCLIVPGLILLLGIGVIALGFAFPDVQTWNSARGRHESIGDNAPIIGGVFCALGVAGLLLGLYVEREAARGPRPPTC